MNARSPGQSSEGWFSTSGPEYDVALSSRCRLVRNLAAYPFPDFMHKKQREELSARVEAVLSELWPQATHIRLDELPDVERMVLVERNLVSLELSRREKVELYLHENGRLALLVNGRDHVHLQALAPGLELAQSMQELWAVEQVLDRALPFAATLQFGYLTSSVEDLGTGMSASVMLHLPALVESRWLTPALRTIVDEDVGLKAFGGEPERSTAAIYQLFNKLSIGSAENEILEKLEDAVIQLIHYERNAREALDANRGEKLQEEIAGAAETLRTSRTISDSEAYQALSRLRLGVALGNIDEMLFEEITSLFYRCQRSHITVMANGSDAGEQRATLLRDALRIRR